MITDTKSNQYYSGFTKDKKPHGFGVLLTATHLLEGVWISGKFFSGYTHDLKEQKFGFSINVDEVANEVQTKLETIGEDSVQ